MYFSIIIVIIFHEAIDIQSPSAADTAIFLVCKPPNALQHWAFARQLDQPDSNSEILLIHCAKPPADSVFNCS